MAGEKLNKLEDLEKKKKDMCAGPGGTVGSEAGPEVGAEEVRYRAALTMLRIFILRAVESHCWVVSGSNLIQSMCLKDHCCEWRKD